VWEAINKLSFVQRAVVVQRYYVGIGETELARRQSSPVGTIGWRLN